MFDFFKGDKDKVKVVDKVWMSTPAKWNACKAMLALNPQCVFAAWFEDTKEALEQVLQPANGQPGVHLASKLSSGDLTGKMIVFVEHHPFHRKEEEVFTRLGLSEVPVLSALDEPLMLHFGGEQLGDIMKRMGMKEDEPIGHTMVTKSLRNAQRKIEVLVEIEKPASSASTWFSLNLPGKAS